MKRSKKIIVSLLILALWFVPASMLAAQDLAKGVKFLDDVKKVEWYNQVASTSSSDGKGCLTIFTSGTTRLPSMPAS